MGPRNLFMAMVEDGDCDDCGQFWTVRAGGIDPNGQCPECRAKFPLAGGISAIDEADLHDHLIEQGVGLGCC